jgi:hypothetical protein
MQYNNENKQETKSNLFILCIFILLYFIRSFHRKKETTTLDQYSFSRGKLSCCLLACLRSVVAY